MQFGYNNDFENIPEQRSRSSALQGTALGRSRLNQDLRSSNHVNTSVATRSFGLQSRILSSSGNLKFGQDVNEMKRNNISTVSRTFGLISEDLDSDAQNNERLHQEMRRNDCSVNRSVMPRPFGLQTRNLTSFSNVFEDNLRGNDNSELINYRRSNINISSMSRTLDLRSENMGDLNPHDTKRLNQDIRRNNYVNSSLMLRSGGLSSRNLTVNPGLLLSDGGLRLNEDSVHRNFSTSKTFRPITSSSSLVTGLQMQDSESYNDNVIDGFKRPMVSRVIRGRNSTLSSRLFHSENIDRHCKDLSNINGFNVSHVSQRNIDTLSRSRFGLNLRSNCIDNQSISQSVVSGASVKAQLMNLLENLHYSILSIGPHITAEAVGLEFDKAKQSLENISEMSFAPSMWNSDAASVISYSSKNIAPTNSQTTTSSTLDGGLLHLKSSKEILQSLITSNEDRNKSKMKNNSSVHKGGKSLVVRSSRGKESDEEENSSFVFKKPRGYPKKRKSPRVTKVEAPRRVKSTTSKAASKVINLKQWYPIAVGSDLAFCGVDEEGATVKTDAVKKRLNNRKVELISGFACHLIGSPSTMVSILPKKIISLLKNGLTERWRVLQKELLTCQTAENETKKRKSKSPQKVTSSPRKRTVKSPKRKPDRGKVQNLKIPNTPLEDVSGAEMQTRSGRTIKPPRMFWLVADTGSDEVTSSSSQATPHVIEESSQKKLRKGVEETPVKSRKAISETPRRRAKTPRDASRGGTKKEADETPREKTVTKLPEARGNKKKEKEEQVKANSSMFHADRQNKSRQSRGKRKREVAGDAEAAQPKKSKIEKKVEAEVSASSTKGRKKKSGSATSKHSLKLKGQKPSPANKIKTAVKKKVAVSTMESNKEMKDRTEVPECEEDLELKLDDIEIPEIGNVSGNPQLNRSQLRLVSMETPPLKYFTNNLKILGSATPVRSPDWCISQRTASEVKQFQRRREEAFKKKVKVDIKKTVITEKSTKGVQNKDVKRVMEWVAEKTVRSPQWSSKVLQYIIPSRKRMEQQADEEDDEDIDTEFL